MRAELCVRDGIPNIPMTEEILNEPCIQPLVREHVTGAVAQHVRMDVKPNAGGPSSLADDPGYHVSADRAAPFGDEHVLAIHGFRVPAD